MVTNPKADLATSGEVQPLQRTGLGSSSGQNAWTKGTSIMSFSSSISSPAALIADPTRASMLATLVDGSARPAGELARAAGVTPQTASSHLAKLLEGGLLALELEGRHRYYRLAGPHVALALEQLSTLQPPAPPRPRALTREARELRFCRCCYDHLAGRLGVAVTDALVALGFIRPAPDKLFEVTSAGAAWFAGIGLDLAALRPSRRGLARQCLDWTERQHHLAGPLGVALLAAFCARGWMRRNPGSRAVEITPQGWLALRHELGIDKLVLAEAA
jgi:DNA-binding transcriptional ArsR family regulator